MSVIALENVEVMSTTIPPATRVPKQNAASKATVLLRARGPRSQKNMIIILLTTIREATSTVSKLLVPIPTFIRQRDDYKNHKIIIVSFNGQTFHAGIPWTEPTDKLGFVSHPPLCDRHGNGILLLRSQSRHISIPSFFFDTAGTVPPTLHCSVAGGSVLLRRSSESANGLHETARHVATVRSSCCSLPATSNKTSIIHLSFILPPSALVEFPLLPLVEASPSTTLRI